MREAADFRLSRREFDILWSDLGGGNAPYPLEVSGHGATFGERDAIRAEVYEGLRAKGLFGDRLHEGLEGLFGVLARPRVSVDVTGYSGGPLRALAARTKRTAVLVAMIDGDVELTAIRPTALVGSVVGLLPDAELGGGPAMSVRFSDLQKVTSEDEAEVETGLFDEETERDALVREGVSGENATWLVRMADNRTGGGQFGVSVHESGTGECRSPTLVTWFDTDTGRYLMVRKGDWLSIAPADHARIANRLGEVLSAEAD